MQSAADAMLVSCRHRIPLLVTVIALVLLLLIATSPSMGRPIAPIERHEAVERGKGRSRGGGGAQSGGLAKHGNSNDDDDIDLSSVRDKSDDSVADVNGNGRGGLGGVGSDVALPAAVDTSEGGERRRPAAPTAAGRGQKRPIGEEDGNNRDTVELDSLPQPQPHIGMGGGQRDGTPDSVDGRSDEAMPQQTTKRSRRTTQRSTRATADIQLSGSSGAYVHVTTLKEDAFIGAALKEREGVIAEGLVERAERVATCATAKSGNGGTRGGQSTLYAPLPTCPPFTHHANDNKDTVADRQSDFIGSKYEWYASRCAKRDGLMWSQLTRDSFEKIAGKVLKLFLSGTADDDGSLNPTIAEPYTSYRLKAFFKPNEQRGVAEAVLMKHDSSSAEDKDIPTLRILDWGSGCGAGLRFFSSYLLEAFATAVRKDATSASALYHTAHLSMLGIDLIAGAVKYAEATILPSVLEQLDRHRIKAATIMPSKSKDGGRETDGDHGNDGGSDSTPLVSSLLRLTPTSNASFCHADGTDLSWIPDGSFDYVTAFGALLHVPSSHMCSTLRELLRVVRVGGAVWGGYIDEADTVYKYSQCDLRSVCQRPKGGRPADGPPPSPPYTIDFTIIRERQWLKRVGMPKVLLKKNPMSLLWRKVPS